MAAMDLTIAELARAVGKNETYVRQHIHRKHLITRRMDATSSWHSTTQPDGHASEGFPSAHLLVPWRQRET